jgi:hypothetical protein
LLLSSETNTKKVLALSDSSVRIYKSYFDTISAIRDLEKSEQDLLDKIELKIAGNLKDDIPTPVSDLNPTNLSEVLGVTVDQTVVDK